MGKVAKSLQAVWCRLQEVEALTVKAAVDGSNPWQGRGHVEVRQSDPRVIEWKEDGSWAAGAKGLTSFHSAYRWTLRQEQEYLSLSHLRRGSNQSVSLLDFEPLDESRWVAHAPHRCGADCYTAEVRLAPKGLVLAWRITGPKKDLRLRTEYRGLGQQS